MIFVILAVLSHTAVIILMRLTEVKDGNRYATTFFNFIVCTILSIMFLEDKSTFLRNGDVFTLCFSFYDAVFMTAGMVFTRISIGINGTPLTTTFNRLGVLLPAILSIAFLGENPTLIQVLSIAVVAGTIVYMNHGKEEQQGAKSPKWLAIIFLACGMIDFNTKLFEAFGREEMQQCFILYVFLWCTLVSLTIMMCKNRKISKQDVVVGALTGIPNQLLLLFSMKAVNVLPAYIVFPANSAGIILCVNLINVFVFKEPLSKKEKMAIGIIAIALVLINL